MQVTDRPEALLRKNSQPGVFNPTLNCRPEGN